MVQDSGLLWGCMGKPRYPTASPQVSVISWLYVISNFKWPKVNFEEWRAGCANCVVPMVTEFKLQFYTEMDIFETIRPKAPH